MAVEERHPADAGLRRGNSLSRLLGLDQNRVDPSLSNRANRLLATDGWSVFAAPTPTPPGDPVGPTFATADGDVHRIIRTEDGRVHVPFDLDDAYTNYVSEAWAAASDVRRLSPATLAVYYRIKRVVPRQVQLRARRALVRRQTPSFPTWPLDRGVERLTELSLLQRLGASGESELPFRWFWPDAFHAAFVLSHDVESAEGQRLAIEIADLEEAYGFRSSFNFGAWYDVDRGVLRELEQRGFEIGMHGLIHDRTLFSSRAAFTRQLPGLRDLADDLGAVGFRSPATHRVWEWLGELPVEYDGTIPHSDPYEPQPGGCCSLWPFFIGDVVELPYTLPQDHTLLTLLRHRTPDLWISTARSIMNRFGLVHCISHPDRGYLAEPGRRAVYGEFLEAMAERESLWHALPRDVARWWRSRDARAPATGVGIARAVSNADEVELVPPRQA